MINIVYVYSLVPCSSSLLLLVLIVYILTRRLPLPLQAHVCKQDYFWQKTTCTHTYTRTHVRRICAKKKTLLRCYATHFFSYSSPISNFFSNPAKVAATAPTTLKRVATWTVSRVPDAPRGCRVAQRDGLVRLTILSADGHPKGARGHAPARSQQSG